eukprot:7565812-Lingulodinium_polyedra.AAC.1
MQHDATWTWTSAASSKRSENSLTGCARPINVEWECADASLVRITGHRWGFLHGCYTEEGQKVGTRQRQQTVHVRPCQQDAACCDGTEGNGGAAPHARKLANGQFQQRMAPARSAQTGEALAPRARSCAGALHSGQRMK